MSSINIPVDPGINRRVAAVFEVDESHIADWVIESSHDNVNILTVTLVMPLTDEEAWEILGVKH